MSLANSVKLLRPDQLLSLHDVLINAGLCFESGNDPTEIFRVEKHKHSAGALYRIYRALQHATRTEIDALLQHLVLTKVEQNGG